MPNPPDHPISEQELWAAADMVLRQHGDNALVFVAERIGALALQGDETGIAVWKSIARRLDELRARTALH